MLAELNSPLSEQEIRDLLSISPESLEVSRALHDSFASPNLIAPATFWQNVVGVFNIRRHAWRYAFATLTLLLLLLGTALLIKRENSHFVNVRPPKVLPRPTATVAPQPAHHPPNSSAPTHNETSPVLPLHEGLATSIVLYSGTPLESAPAISTSGDFVTVQLMLNEPLAESYEVSLTTASGESVFSADGLKRADQKTLGFVVPANSLRPGDFQVTLTRIDGESKQNNGIYYFRVR